MSLKVLFVASEAHPLVKTGGLADVAGALPRALARLGADVRLLLPAYRGVAARVPDLREVGRLELTAAPAARLLRGRMPRSRARVYLLDIPELYDRPGGPYTGPDGRDWPDNAWRFAALGRAAVALALGEGDPRWRPDLVHAHDWQAGLAPALLSLERERPATVFTVHNLAYQGVFPWETFRDLALPWELWSMERLEYYGQFAFIKGGLACADWLTTVSPTYAREIQTPEHGFGLDGLLRHRAARLVGILNGIDYEEWSPGRDPHLAARFTRRTLARRARNKAAVQARFGLPTHGGAPLLGHIGRLVEQKGADLILGALDGLLAHGAQLVVLGSGAPHLERAVREAAARYPDRVGVHVGYDEPLAHLIEGGVDMFLMPSRFEPCGLNQMYSLRYGAVPVVRRTGGLADTVVDADEAALAEGRATGFVFDAPEPAALLEACRRAIACYRERPADWRRIVLTGMAQDFSWRASARRYLELYRRALLERRGAARAPGV